MLLHFMTMSKGIVIYKSLNFWKSSFNFAKIFRNCNFDLLVQKSSQRNGNLRFVRDLSLSTTVKFFFGPRYPPPHYLCNLQCYKDCLSATGNQHECLYFSCCSYILSGKLCWDSLSNMYRIFSALYSCLRQKWLL